MNDLIERFEQVVSEVEREHAPLTFAALVEPDDSGVSQYDFIVSSPWFLQEGKLRSYQYLKEKLSRALNKEDWNRFNKIQLMNPDEQFIQDLTMIGDQFKNRDLVNLQAGGVDLRSAHIFAAQPQKSPVRLRSYIV